MTTTDLFLFAMLGLLLVFMFMQSRKRRKQAEELMAAIAVGDKVVLHSGIMGTVTEVSDSEVVFETTPKTKIRVVKQAIRTREAAASGEN